MHHASPTHTAACAALLPLALDWQPSTGHVNAAQPLAGLPVGGRLCNSSTHCVGQAQSTQPDNWPALLPYPDPKRTHHQASKQHRCLAMPPKQPAPAPPNKESKHSHQTTKQTQASMLPILDYKHSCVLSPRTHCCQPQPPPLLDASMQATRPSPSPPAPTQPGTATPSPHTAESGAVCQHHSHTPSCAPHPPSQLNRERAAQTRSLRRVTHVGSTHTRPCDDTSALC